MRSPAFVALCVLTACFDPTKSGGNDEGSGDASTGGTGTTMATTATTASTTDATTTNDDTLTTSATAGVDGSSSGGSDSANDTTTGEPPPICEHAMPTLTACAAPGVEDVPNYDTVACDPSVGDYSVFYEDVYPLDLAAGQCVYVHVDNVGVNGPTGVANSDLAFQLRSPSGAYAWQDDDVPCTDPVWNSGTCPQAMIAADIDGAYELAIVQASGMGCISGSEYTVFISIAGAPVGPTVTGEDVMYDCTP